ncbi:MAG: HAD family hydrolase [Candidatus Hermodarchaeota archaeon]
MDADRIPLKAIIFDAGDIFLRPNYEKATIAKERLFSFLKSHLIHENALDDNLQIIWKKLVKFGLSSQKTITHDTGFGIPISLIENIEIAQWWKNLDLHSKDLFKYLSHEGYKLGILTDSILLPSKIREFLEGFAHYVQAIVSSREVGATKPDPLMYQTIMTKLDIKEPARCLFVGHDPEELEGAEKFGFFTVDLLDHNDSLLQLKKFIKETYQFER